MLGRTDWLSAALNHGYPLDDRAVGHSENSFEFGAQRNSQPHFPASVFFTRPGRNALRSRQHDKNRKWQRLVPKTLETTLAAKPQVSGRNDISIINLRKISQPLFAMCWGSTLGSK